MTEAWAVVEEGRIMDGHDTERLVPWWSVTKTVLAAAALVLVRNGLVALNSPLAGKPYTLRHLLQHQAGLADYGGIAAYHQAVARGDDPWTASDLLKRADADRLRHAAGEEWGYSNIGYLFVRQLIEVVTGEDLNTALRRLVLMPLGIVSARIAVDRADLQTVAMGSAQRYHPAWVYHGLLVGSVADAALLLDRLLAGNVLPSDLLKDMLTPFVLPGPIPGRPWKVPGYGLGVMTGVTTSGTRVAGHTGGGPGSTIAVYGALPRTLSRTAVCFRTSEDQALTEAKAFRLLTR